MPLSTAGRDFIVAAIIGDDTGTAGQALTTFNNANAAVGSGDSATAFAASQTDLQAATNKLRKGMMATFPTRATNVLTFKGSFAAAEANWVWNEVGIFNSPTAGTGTMLSRVVTALGTKVSPAVWELSIALTITVS